MQHAESLECRDPAGVQADGKPQRSGPQPSPRQDHPDAKQGHEFRDEKLRVGKVVVGTYTGGVNGAPLQIELNSNATLERVRTVLQNIIFRGTNRSGGPRIVTIQVTDETQLASNVATKTVDVT